MMHLAVIGAAFPMCETREPDETTTSRAAFELWPHRDVCPECWEKAGLPKVYVIPSDNVAHVQKKIDDLNRRAAKLGVEGITATIRHDSTQKWTETNEATGKKVERAREWFALTISRPKVGIPGWTFLATLYHSTEGNIIAAVPGSRPLPIHFRTAPSACHHCKQIRRRKATYVVLEEATDRTVQVGSSCIRDFLGHDAERMATWAEYLASFDASMNEEREYSGPRTEFVFSLSSFLSFAAAAIRKDGWVSRKFAAETEQTSTASRAWNLLTMPATTSEQKRVLQEYTPTEGDDDLVARALEWARTSFATEPEKGWSDYEHNLGVVVRSDLVVYRTSGLAASLLQAYRRAMDIATERAQTAAATATSEWVGTAGERLKEIPVKVMKITPLPATEWGPRNLVKLVDDAGNVFVWFTGSVGVWVFPDRPAAREPMPGDRMWLTGTVKKHSSFANTKQTELSRCLLASVEPTPKKAKKTKKAGAA